MKHVTCIRFSFVRFVRMLLHCRREHMTIAAFVNEAVGRELARLDVAIPTHAQALAIMASRRESSREIATGTANTKTAHGVAVVGSLSTH